MSEQQQTARERLWRWDVMLALADGRTDFSNCDLRGTDLSGADMRGTILNGANLDGVTLTLDQIGDALFSEGAVVWLLARAGYVKGAAPAPYPHWLVPKLTPFVLDKIEELLLRIIDVPGTREQTAAHLNSLALAWRLAIDGDIAKACDHIEDVTAGMP